MKSLSLLGAKTTVNTFAKLRRMVNTFVAHCILRLLMTTFAIKSCMMTCVGAGWWPNTWFYVIAGCVRYFSLRLQLRAADAKRGEIKHKDFCVEEFIKNELETEKKEREKKDLIAKFTRR